ncbi:MAG TPA: (Na+)-NQR maturation NqrM [Pseudomonadales bacterium]|nr:(Na+)-NQR maturation NqrM [Pseudomonadales bacterium]HNC69756.1 (Na+)-NQR maturation NqrM [Pseudomonadales bacterium]HND13426.1 (Na+)-NQR maturation NqrM [Pseudomonadales bacterium]
MSTILFSVGFFLLMTLAMAIGVMAGRKPIKGSCGGISAMSGADCPVCGGDSSKCDSKDNGTDSSKEEGRRSGPAAAYYDATHEER